MIRVQRKRIKGWRKPENAVDVTRSSKWGNPFKLVGDQIYIHAGYRRAILDPWVHYGYGNLHYMLALYGSLINKTMIPETRDEAHWVNHFSKLDISELAGKDLMCYCPLHKPCHVDVIIKKVKELIR